jgi:hypothetical protein
MWSEGWGFDHEWRGRDATETWTQDGHLYAAYDVSVAGMLVKTDIPAMKVLRVKEGGHLMNGDRAFPATPTGILCGVWRHTASDSVEDS